MQREGDWKIAKGPILLASIPEDVADMILARSNVQKFGRPATIFLQGDAANSVYIVLEAGRMGEAVPDRA